MRLHELHLNSILLLYCSRTCHLLQIVVLVAEILVGIVTARQGFTLLRRLDPVTPHNISAKQVQYAAYRTFQNLSPYHVQLCPRRIWWKVIICRARAHLIRHMYGWTHL